MKPEQRFNQPTVRAAAAADVAKLLQEMDIDPCPVFKQAGLDVNTINDPYLQIPLNAQTHVVELAAQASRPDLGLLVGLQQNPNKWGAYGYVLLNSPTVGVALHNLATFLKPWQSGTHCSYRVEGKFLTVEYSITHPSVQHKAQDAEFSVVYIKHLVDCLCEREVRPVAIDFEHSAIASKQRYKELLGLTPQFNQTINRICFPRALENKPIPSADLQLYPVLRKHLEEMAAAMPEDDDLQSQLLHHIRQLLPLRECKIDKVAKSMALEVRTLQRQLKKLGFSFTGLVNQVKEEQAREFLSHSRLEIKEIAYLLSFNDNSAFTTAFKSWTGQTPGQYRQARG